MNTKTSELSVKVSVPAKVMLVGEYAVMEGHHSLSLALDKNLSVIVKPTPNLFSTIHSSLWDEPFFFSKSTELKSFDNILTQAVFKALENWSDARFFDLYISSDFCVSSGYGSSSALRLAVLTALQSFYNQEEVSSTEQWSLAKEAFCLQRDFQGKASGYDTLTQQVGGVVSFKDPHKNWPGEWNNLDFDLKSLKDNLHIFIGGKGAPTKDSMLKTSFWLDNEGSKDIFYKSSDNLYQSLVDFFCKKSNSKAKVIRSFSRHRQLMSNSPSFPSSLGCSLGGLSGLDRDWSYKTTGSGGEDAILFFGSEESLSHVFKMMETNSWRRESWKVQTRGNTLEWIN